MSFDKVRRHSAQVEIPTIRRFGSREAGKVPPNDKAETLLARLGLSPRQTRRVQSASFTQHKQYREIPAHHPTKVQPLRFSAPLNRTASVTPDRSRSRHRQRTEDAKTRAKLSVRSLSPEQRPPESNTHQPPSASRPPLSPMAGSPRSPYPVDQGSPAVVQRVTLKMRADGKSPVRYRNPVCQKGTVKVARHKSSPPLGREKVRGTELKGTGLRRFPPGGLPRMATHLDLQAERAVKEAHQIIKAGKPSEASEDIAALEKMHRALEENSHTTAEDAHSTASCDDDRQ